MNREPMVYICSPLRATTEEGMKRNMKKAQDYMNFVSKRYGCRAVAPHAYLPQFLDDYTPEERALGLYFGQELLKLCKAMIVCGDRISSGMKAEIDSARRLGIPVFSLSLREEKPATTIVVKIVGERSDMYI